MITPDRPCPDCGGSGLVHRDAGFMDSEDVCKTCEGYGTISQTIGEPHATTHDESHSARPE